MCKNPGGCDNCLWSYPRGCLHTLNESERNTPEMNNVMDAFDSFTNVCDSHPNYTEHVAVEFWDRPENARHVDEKMVRFVLFMVIKLIVQKEKITPHWKMFAEAYFFNGVMLYNGMVECGSMATALNAMARCAESPEERNMLEKKCASWAFGVICLSAVADSRTNGYYGLLFVLNELTPCGCLRKELREEAKRSPQAVLFHCAYCDKRETFIRQYRLCSKCRVAFYCSRECQEKDWKEDHRRACKGVRKLVSLLHSHGE